MGPPFTSKDIDLLGGRDLAARCAARLKGRPEYNDNPSDFHSAKVIFHDHAGHSREIDFLTEPFGLRSEEVIRTSVPVEVDVPGGETVSFRVMQPVVCMISRAKNVAGLPLYYNNSHGLRQLSASVLCAKEYLRRLLASGDVRPVLKLNQKIFRFCYFDLEGRKVEPMTGIDPFAAVLVDGDHPKMRAFREKRYPQIQASLTERRAKLAAPWRRP